MGSNGRRGRGVDPVSRWFWFLLVFCLIAAALTKAFPTTLQESGNSANKDGAVVGAQNSNPPIAKYNETAASSNAIKESDSSEKHIGLPSSEVSEAPLMDQDPTETLNEHPTRLDYYEDMQILKDPDEDDTPVLPEHAVNVNEDYAGIYDYRGSPDGRYRRKRTLTTNIEQLLIRSSRLNRVRRSISDNSLSETISAGERAERLVSLLRILQDADPAFDANDFLKVLHTPSVSDQDLEYLIYLSNIADLTGATALFPRPADRDHDVRERNFDASEKQSVQGNLETARSLQSTWPELIELARMQQQRRKGQQKQHFLQQSSEPFFLVPDFILLDDSSIASKREQPPKSSLTFSRLFAIAALMAQQQYDPTGIAM